MPSDRILKQKQAEVDKIAERFSQSPAIVVVDHRGLTVEEDTKLRAELRKSGVTYKVTKNTLAIKAAEKIGVADSTSLFTGPTAIATHEEDVAVAARILSNFAREHKKLELKGAILEGEVVGVDGVKALASLPTKEVLIAKVLGGFNAPITGFVNVLNGNIRGLVVALNAIKEQKQGA
ncbi:MAG TPA: 50S ribosomal protein L10 [Clostridia bacterium]|nr:50S ribosomal protein L10 [Clostridia bacterium]